MKVVYVTGCLGFIGYYVAKACLDKGWYVKGVDCNTYAANEKLLDVLKLNPNFDFVNCRIENLQFLYDCDYVINTAAETHVDNSIVESDVFIETNIKGVHNLLQLIRTKKQYSMPTFFQFSTDEVYGDIIEGSHNETHLLKPSNPYSATKASADQLILAWARTHDVMYNIIRPTNNYGIGQYIEKLIPKAIKTLTLGNKIPLHQQGIPTRMWLHAKDTAAAVIKIIEEGERNEIYNVSGDEEFQNIQVVRNIIDLYNTSTPDRGDELSQYSKYLNMKYSRPGHDVRYSLDDSKLRNLGWTPKKKLWEELPAIVEYYMENFIW